MIHQGIDLDISINEPIGAATFFEVSPDLRIRVATIEDIVAEKLRALLQQLIRNWVRPQDLLDIAVVLRSASQGSCQVSASHSIVILSPQAKNLVLLAQRPT